LVTHTIITVGVGDRVTLEPVEKGDRFRIGEMENMSKKVGGRGYHQCQGE
jgi:hypothetical protein